MKLQALIATMAMAITMTTSLSAEQALFDPETGIASERFQTQLQIVGLTPKSFFIDDVACLLEEIGCFQRDQAFYKNGNHSLFSKNLTIEQAVAFLNDEYSHRATLLPETKKGVTHAIMNGSLDPYTMQKRLCSLQSALNAGLEIKTIHIVIDRAEAAEETAFINTLIASDKYNALFQELSVNYYSPNPALEINFTEGSLQVLKASQNLADEYYVVTDASFTTRLPLMINSTFQETGKICLGVSVAPVTNWNEEMEAYGYNIAFKNHDDAIIARAATDWNFKARQVHVEWEAFQNKLSDSTPEVRHS